MRTQKRNKKTRLKNGTVLAAEDLADCLGADPKGKIAKACDDMTGKLAAKILPKRCVAKGVDLTAASTPSCCREINAGDASGMLEPDRLVRRGERALPGVHGALPGGRLLRGL